MFSRSGKKGLRARALKVTSDNVMVTRGITKDRFSKSNVYPCVIFSLWVITKFCV